MDDNQFSRNSFTTTIIIKEIDGVLSYYSEGGNQETKRIANHMMYLYENDVDSKARLMFSEPTVHTIEFSQNGQPPKILR